MGKNQFLFIVANKMFLMIIDKGETHNYQHKLEKEGFNWIEVWIKSFAQKYSAIRADYKCYRFFEDMVG